MMTPFNILLSALALAFCWVHYINPINRKPFNCIKCMAGWLSLLVYAANLLCTHQLNAIHIACAPLYLACGVFTGALFEAVAMRWL